MPYLNPADLRAAIAATIETVPGAGRVYTRRRVVRSENDLRAYYWDSTLSRVCGWQVSPAPSGTMVSDRKPGYAGHGAKGGGNVITTFAFQIEGIFQLDDANASEETFQDLVWAVADEFNAYGTIAASGGGPVAALFHQLPCDVQQFGYIMLAGSPLCHYARLEVGFQGRTRG
jgi:hypothetical protein